VQCCRKDTVLFPLQVDRSPSGNPLAWSCFERRQQAILAALASPRFFARLLGGCHPVERLMRALRVVGVEPGIEGSLEFLQAAPVLSPDEFGLEGQDEPFHHGVAGRMSVSTEKRTLCSLKRDPPWPWGVFSCRVVSCDN